MKIVIVFLFILYSSFSFASEGKSLCLPSVHEELPVYFNNGYMIGVKIMDNGEACYYRSVYTGLIYFDYHDGKTGFWNTQFTLLYSKNESDEDELGDIFSDEKPMYYWQKEIDYSLIQIDKSKIPIGKKLCRYSFIYGCSDPTLSLIEGCYSYNIGFSGEVSFEVCPAYIEKKEELTVNFSEGLSDSNNSTNSNSSNDSSGSNHSAGSNIGDNSGSNFSEGLSDSNNSTNSNSSNDSSGSNHSAGSNIGDNSGSNFSEGLSDSNNSTNSNSSNNSSGSNYSAGSNIGDNSGSNFSEGLSDSNNSTNSNSSNDSSGSNHSTGSNIGSGFSNNDINSGIAIFGTDKGFDESGIINELRLLKSDLNKGFSSLEKKQDSYFKDGSFDINKLSSLSENDFNNAFSDGNKDVDSALENFFSEIEKYTPYVKFSLPGEFFGHSRNRCIPLDMNMKFVLFGGNEFLIPVSTLKFCEIYDNYLRDLLKFLIYVLTAYSIIVLLDKALRK